MIALQQIYWPDFILDSNLIRAHPHGDLFERRVVEKRLDVVHGEADEEVEDDDGHEEEEHDKEGVRGAGKGRPGRGGLADVEDVVVEVELADHHDDGLEERVAHLVEQGLQIWRERAGRKQMQRTKKRSFLAGIFFCGKMEIPSLKIFVSGHLWKSVICWEGPWASLSEREPFGPSLKKNSRGNFKSTREI